jgi:hypothetical protein
MRETYREVHGESRVSGYRRVLAVMSLLAAVAIIVALTAQIMDLVLNNAFLPTRYFSYFTIVTSLGNIIVLVASGLFGLQSMRDTPFLGAIRSHFVVYGLITGIVYNILLRDLPPAEGAWVSEVTWPNEVTHVWIPLYLVVDWLINPHRQKLPAWSVPVGLIIPLGWLGFTLIRGQVTGWYPYNFLNPEMEPGWAGVGVYLAGIGVIIISVLMAITLVNAIHQKLRPGNRTGQ